MNSQNSSHHPLLSTALPTTLQAQINDLNNANNGNSPLLMSTLQQLSSLSNANLTSQMALNQFGNDLSTIPWSGQSWLDSAKMAAMYNILQTASINEQQLNTINAMNSLERSFKLFTQQTNATQLTSMEQLAAQSTFQNQLGVDALIQQTPNDPLAALFQPQVSAIDGTQTHELTTNAVEPVSFAAHLLTALPTSLQQTTPLLDVNRLQSAMSTFLQLSLPNCIGMEETHQFLPAQPPSMTRVPASASTSNAQQSTRVSSIPNGQIPSKRTIFEEFDFNDLHELILEKLTNNQPPTSAAECAAIATTSSSVDDRKFSASSTTSTLKSTSQQPTTAARPHRIGASNFAEPDLELERFVSTLENNDLDFDFATNHGPFDALKFLKEVAGGTARDSPELVDQAELDPVQFTPPDSPQSFPKPEARDLNSTASSHHDLTSRPSTSAQSIVFTRSRVQNGLPTTSHASTLECTSSVPLVFIPPVSSAATSSSSVEITKPVEPRPVHRSTLLQTTNKVPIYKQQFTNLVNNAVEPKGEDCYSFVDDEFQDLKPTITSSESTKEADGQTKSGVAFEKNSTHVPTVRRPHRDSLIGKQSNAEVTWSEEFGARLRADKQSWIRVDPFQPTEIHVDETPASLRWTTERRKSSLRVIVKEEMPVDVKESSKPQRPRLVLKFIKPAVTTPDLVPSSPDAADKTHKLKRKKHKRKKHDDDWEYPGAVKQRRTEKKHRHHHHRRHSDHQPVVSNGENHVYPTRLAAAIKTESSEHEQRSRRSSPLHGSPSTNGSESRGPDLRLTASSSTNSLISLFTNTLWDPTFTRRFSSFSQTQNELPKGTFVLAKDEAWKEECGLWRIDSQNLLQRFVPCDENPGCYRSSPNYTGWCDEIADNYVVVRIEFLKHSRAETIVRPVYPIDSILPALTFEDGDICCDADEDDRPSSPRDREYVNTVELVANSLLRSCIEVHHSEEVVEEADSINDRAIRGFHELNRSCKEHVHLQCELRRDVTMLLDHYSGLLEVPTTPEQTEGDECLVCGTTDDLQLLGLHSAEHSDSAFPHSMNFFACSTCLEHVRAYHQAHHGFFLLRKACHDHILDLALERPAATGKQLLSLSLKTFESLQPITNVFVELWSEYSSLD